MKELIELRKNLVEQEEEALEKQRAMNSIYGYGSSNPRHIEYRERRAAFTKAIKMLDLILNNSVVKLHDSRSPEGQGEHAVVSRPNDSQNHLIEQSKMFENMQYYMEYCQSNGYVTPHDWIEKFKHF